MQVANFIKELATYVQKYAPQYGIKVYSPIIAQGILESDEGRSSKAVVGHNYFGLKYRPGRCPIAIGYFTDTSKEDTGKQLIDITDNWFKFRNMEEGVIGYFQFTDIPNYASIKGVTDPELYLTNIKAANYATSRNYVKNVMDVIEKYGLRKYDPVANLTYIVQRGDTLGKIAARYNMSYIEIAKHNAIGNPNVIRVGQVLQIPLKSQSPIVATPCYTEQTILAHTSNYGTTRDESMVEFLVIHYTANDGDTGKANGKYFQGANRNASAHDFVDDTSVTHSVPYNRVAYHCGTKKKYYHPKCRNANSIGIEICDTKRDGSYNMSPATRANVIALVKKLMKEYNIPISNVVRHYDVTHKKCPAYFVNDTQAWIQFLNELVT